MHLLYESANEYFSNIANYCFNCSCDIQSKETPEAYWGIFSAALGNQTNNTKFFDRFWSKRNKNSLRYLLERWDCHEETFQELVKKGLYEQNQEWQWIRDRFYDVDRDFRVKWSEERKNFLALTTEFEKLQKQYVEVEAAIEKIEVIERQLLTLNEKIAQQQKVLHENNSVLSETKNKFTEIKQKLDIAFSSLSSIQFAYSAQQVLSQSKAEYKAYTDDISELQANIKKTEREHQLLTSALQELKEEQQSLRDMESGARSSRQGRRG